MEQTAAQSSIPESFLEHRQVFEEAWLDRWIIPNPFISPLFELLRTTGVQLTDFSFNKDATNFGETHLNISIRKFSAAVRIGLDTVTFIVANPDWGMAPEMVHLFDQVSERIRGILQVSPGSQDTTLAFHVTPGLADFRVSTGSLVKENLAKDSVFCGVSLHRGDGALIIDKSLRYEGAAFVRIQCRFAGDVPFAAVASRLYEDELSALGLLGVTGVI